MGTAPDALLEPTPPPPRVNPYSVIDITPFQEEQPPPADAEAEAESASPPVPSGYSVPVPCGYAVPCNLPLLLPAYSNPVVIRAPSLDEEGRGPPCCAPPGGKGQQLCGPCCCQGQRTATRAPGHRPRPRPAGTCAHHCRPAAGGPESSALFGVGPVKAVQLSSPPEVARVLDPGHAGVCLPAPGAEVLRDGGP